MSSDESSHKFVSGEKEYARQWARIIVECDEIGYDGSVFLYTSAKIACSDELNFKTLVWEIKEGYGPKDFFSRVFKWGKIKKLAEELATVIIKIWELKHSRQPGQK